MGKKYVRMNGESMPQFQARVRAAEAAQFSARVKPARHKRQRRDVYNEDDAIHGIGDYEINGPDRNYSF